MQRLGRHAFRGLGELPGGAYRPRGRAGRPDADLDEQAGDGAARATCQAHGHVEQNVAGEAIDGALPALPGSRRGAAGGGDVEGVPLGEAMPSVPRARRPEAPFSSSSFETVGQSPARLGPASGRALSEMIREAESSSITHQIEADLGPEAAVFASDAIQGATQVLRNIQRLRSQGD